jgi:hypothetical protein
MPGMPKALRQLLCERGMQLVTTWGLFQIHCLAPGRRRIGAAAVRERRAQLMIMGLCQCWHWRQDEAALTIQRCYRAHCLERELRRRSFSKFGDEALGLIRQCAPCCLLPITLLLPAPCRIQGVHADRPRVRAKRDSMPGN